MVLTLSRQFVTLTGTGKAVRVFSFLLTYTPQHVRGEGELAHSSIPVAMPSKALVCDTLIRGIADSSPTGIMDVRLLCILCVV